MLEPEEVEEILLLLDSADVDELHLRTRRFALTLRRTPGGWSRSFEVLRPDGGAAVHSPETGTGPDAGDGSGAAPKAEPPGEPDGTASRAGLVEVTAPLVGTFYRAPRPGAPAFVEVGSPVGADTVVGIVETMKLMTSVLAGVHGTVAEICRADAQLVEQGAVLMRIEPTPEPEPTEPASTEQIAPRTP